MLYVATTSRVGFNAAPPPVAASPAKLPPWMSGACARAFVGVVCGVAAMRVFGFTGRARPLQNRRAEVLVELGEIINESPSHRRRDRPALRLEDSGDGGASERD